MAIRGKSKSFLVLFLLAGIAPRELAAGFTGVEKDAQISSASAAGVLFVCPAGDGDLMSDKGLTITSTVTSLEPVSGIPASDFWVVGCANGLDLCAGDRPFNSGVTDANGTIVLDGRISTGGCDNSGLRVMFQGSYIIIESTCVPIQTRSPDLKSSGPGACGGDIICPDGKVDLADYGYLVSRYPTQMNPAPPYQPCLDLATPFTSPIGLADFAKLATHYDYNGVTHGCP